MTKLLQFPEIDTQKFHIFIADSDTTSLHGHSFLEFTYVSQGTIEHILDGSRSVVTEGDYFIVDYGTVHSYRRISEAPLRVINLLFCPDFLDQILSGRRHFEDAVNSYLLRFNYRSLRSSPTGRVFHDEDGKIRQLVEEAVQEYEQQLDGCIEYIRCLLVKLLIITMRRIGRSEECAKTSDLVRQMAEHIRTHFCCPTPLSRLAQQQGYSAAYLSRKFSQEMGMGYSEYVQRVRVGQSCHLLESTRLPISEIAAAVGYEDPKFFHQVFRKILHTSPREYRRTMGNK